MAWPVGETYIIDSERSGFRVRVGAAGPLAVLGHAHTIGSEAIKGQVVIAEPWQHSAFELQFDVDDLQVDPPQWRRRADLEGTLSEEAIAGTTSNMRSARQLNADQFPTITLRSHEITGSIDQPIVEVDVTVAGRTTQQSISTNLEVNGQTLIVSGIALWQLTGLGIQPFSALGGGLRVADEIELRFTLYATSGNDQSIGD